MLIVVDLYYNIKMKEGGGGGFIIKLNPNDFISIGIDLRSCLG